MKFETKIKIQDVFIKHRAYFERGQSFFYSIKTALQIIVYGGAGLFLYFGYKPPIYVIVLAGLTYMFFNWFIGRYLDNIGYFHRETEFSNKRNPMFKQLKEKLELKEDIVKHNKTE